MAKSFGAVALLAALCLVDVAHCLERLTVQGPVYCDTCRVDFPTPLSYDLKGAKVKLECRNRTTSVVTLAAEGTTDEFGWYSITVDGDHEEELCEIMLLQSGDANCNELLEGAIYHARISLTNRNGVTQTARFANSLGFATKESHANCTQVLLEMGVLPPDFLY